MKKFLMVMATMLIMPAMLFAKAEIVAYHQSWRGAVSNERLDRITHLIVFQVLPLNDGSLDRKALDTGWFTKNWVKSAQARGVKVSVAVGGWQENISPGSANWVSATSGTNFNRFVDNIVTLVNEFELDGLDIDWEYPQGESGWSVYMNLCNELRRRLPGKRLTSALPGSTPSDKQYTSVVRQGIMKALDAIHLMAYDMESSWGNHADINASKQLIDDWAAWTSGTTGYSKEKLFLGVPFYSKKSWQEWKDFGTQENFNKDDGVLSVWNAEKGISENIQNSWNGGPTLKNKTGHCFTNGYGGIMIWELGHDFAPTNNLSLLKVIYDETLRLNDGKLGGGGTITPDPDPTRFNIPGNIEICGYSAINNGECENGSNIGYTDAGSSVEYLIKVNTAGSYKISMQTAEGNGQAQTITINNGNTKLGEIAVPAGTPSGADDYSQWSVYSSQNTDITLPAGDMTLKITVSGPVNFKDISITKNSGNEPDPDPDAPDLADGTFEWAPELDAENTGSSVNFNVSEGDISFEMKIGVSDDEAKVYTWASIASYTGGAEDGADWTGMESIDIKYTSSADLVLSLADNQGWGEDGRAFYVVLPSGTNMTVNIPMSQFKQLKEDAPDWIEDGLGNWIPNPDNPDNFNNIDLSQLSVFEGVSISPNTENVAVSGHVFMLKMNGLVFEPEEPTAIQPKTAKLVSKVMSAGIMNGAINLSLPTTAKNATVALFDVRGRMLMQREISLNSGVANVALPKNVAKNQAVILQIKTNSGINLTKRVLLK